MNEEEINATVREIFAQRFRGAVRYQPATKHRKARLSFNISNPVEGEPVVAKFEEFRKLKELLNAETFSAVYTDGTKDASGGFTKDGMTSLKSIQVSIEGLERE